MIKLILVLSFIGLSAFAQDNSSSADVEPQSSQANRENKRFTVTGNLEGYQGGGMIGAEGGIFLTPATVLSVGLATGGLSTKYSYGDDYWNDYDENRASQATVSVKQFFTNSFYAKGGVGYRNMNIRHYYGNWFSNANSARGSYEFEGEMAGATLSVGNQWQWNNFTLGADWITMWLPVYSHLKSEKYSFNSSSVADRTVLDEGQSKQDELLKNASFAITFYIGASF